MDWYNQIKRYNYFNLHYLNCPIKEITKNNCLACLNNLVITSVYPNHTILLILCIGANYGLHVIKVLRYYFFEIW